MISLCVRHLHRSIYSPSGCAVILLHVHCKNLKVVEKSEQYFINLLQMPKLGQKKCLCNAVTDLWRGGRGCSHWISPFISLSSSLSLIPFLWMFCLVYQLFLCSLFWFHASAFSWWLLSYCAPWLCNAICLFNLDFILKMYYFLLFPLEPWQFVSS